MSKQGQPSIKELQQRLEEAENNTVLAATYGKQLLQENHDLRAKLEDDQKKVEVSDCTFIVQGIANIPWAACSIIYHY